MSGQNASGPSWSRRDLLRAFGTGAAGLAATPWLASCDFGPGGDNAERPANGANDVSGSFDWKKADGASIKILQTPHPYQQSFQPLLKDFTKLTGIEVQAELVPEARYHTQLNTELARGTGGHDVFMTGAYFIWQYGPPGWLEDLSPWLDSSSATSDEYDFEDIYQGLRTSTRWTFKQGSPLGNGGQWALPWGFETNVVAYNKAYFDSKKIKPADTFDNFIQLAVDLTDRSQNRYGVAFRGSKSWATIHPGFMTQYSREGAVDYTADGGELRAAMSSDRAVDFTRKWVQLAKQAGPTSWTTYDQSDCTRDLADGTAMMVYDADRAAYPKNKPGASDQAGNLAWHPGPAGPDGSYATNLWTWSLAMNAGSKNKLAAWLFIQWATGKDAMSKGVHQGAFANPARRSVFDGAFKQTLGDFPGYLDTFETVIGQTKVQFTPQAKFLETTESWSVALQDIYAGQDAKARLDALAERNTKAVNA